MWLGAGISLLDMDSLRVADLARVREAADHYEAMAREGG